MRAPLAVLSVLALGLAACGNDDAAAPATTTSPGATAAPTTAPPPTATIEPPNFGGDVAWGLDPSGTIVRLDLATGSREDLPGAGPGRRPDLAFNPGRSTLLATRTVGECRVEVVTYDPFGGETEVIGEGFAAALTPDGERIAVASETEECGAAVTIGVGPVGGPADRFWTQDAEPEGPLEARHLRWVGREVVFELHDTDGIDLRALDTTSASGSLVDASRELSPPDDLDVAWRLPTLLDGPEIAVAETPQLGRGERADRLVTVDLTTGERRRELAVLDLRALDMASDPTSTQLLVVTGDPGEPGTTQVLRWTPAGLETVGQGVVDVAW